MRRRDFITLLGGATVASPFVARAQPSALPVIGYLYTGTPEASTNVLAAFRAGLAEIGYVEGRNVSLEFRFAHNVNDRLPELAADLVRRRVAVIATPAATAAAIAAKGSTTTIPIVFSIAGDPVQLGLVNSLNRPGGNVTGIASMNFELGPKRLGLLHQLLPGARRFGVLANPIVPPASEMLEELRAVGAAVGIAIEVAVASTNQEIEVAFAQLAQKQVEGLVVIPNALFFNRRVQLSTLAVRYRIPAIYSDRDYAEAGGLMSYSSNPTDRYRQAGTYVGRILKGERPADLPVMRPTKFELVVNLQTARAIGIEVPPQLLAITDEVIE